MCAAKKGKKRNWDVHNHVYCWFRVDCFNCALGGSFSFTVTLVHLAICGVRNGLSSNFSQAFRFCKANNFVMQSLIWKSLSYELRSNQLWHATARLYVNGEGRRKKESTVPSLQNFFSFFASEKAFCTIRLNPNLLPSSFRHLSSLQPSF